MNGVCKSSFAVAGVLLMFTGFAGCGPSLGKPVDVTGTVTFDGQPLADAMVTFHALEDIPADYRTRSGRTDAEGMYSLEGVYPAQYQVMVQKLGGNAAALGEDPGMAPAVFTDDPLADYSAESPLRADVSTEKTTFDFSLPQ